MGGRQGKADLSREDAEGFGAIKPYELDEQVQGSINSGGASFRARNSIHLLTM